MFDRILLTWIKLGARERRLLVKIAQRLLMGQDQYGYLTIHKKPWRKETLEEFIDGTIYMAAELIDMEDSAPSVSD